MPTSIVYALVACFAGFVIGALPGLTATMGIALMTTLTLKLPSTHALLILVCTYVGAIYGGSRSAILLNIPGTPASAASCLDGHALARQGHAGRAMGIATIGLRARHLDWHGLPCFLHARAGRDCAEVRRLRVLLARRVRRRDLWQSRRGNDPLKGWIAGLRSACSSPASGRKGSMPTTASPSAIPIFPAAFADAGAGRRFRLCRSADSDERASGAPRRSSQFDSAIAENHGRAAQYWRTIIRSGLIGTGIGILPGVGEDVAAWSSYAAARARQQGEGVIRQRLDRRPDGGRDRR